MCTRFFLRLVGPLLLSWLLPLTLLGQQPPAPLAKPAIDFMVQNASESLKMTIHTSRILVLERRIAQIQVDNAVQDKDKNSTAPDSHRETETTTDTRDLGPARRITKSVTQASDVPDAKYESGVLRAVAISPKRLLISAEGTGVARVNIWDEEQRFFAVDVIVFDDVRELEMVLRNLFPTVALKVTPLKLTNNSQSVAISGFIDKPEHVDRIMRIAEQYYKKENIVNNMTVGGCQQVLLHARIMEVSRTKLRRLGFDFSKVTGASTISSGAAGLLNTIVTTPGSVISTNGFNNGNTTAGLGNFAFGVVKGNSAFFGVLDALREDDLAKTLAEPTLTTTSGASASFCAGGEFYIIPNGQNGGPPLKVKYGTQLDFVPVVLGNGRVRLDVCSTISEPDPSQPSQYQPAIKERTAKTSAEMETGQTLAIAGLVQTQIEAQNGGLPWISEVPYLGAAFRTVHEQRNEIELLIMITPEFVEAMDACEVPPCGPGMQTTSPSDWELFMKGHLEVPNCCPTGGGNGPGGPGGDAAGGPPPDGMMPPPGEQIPAPPPADGSGQGTVRDGSRPPAAAMARRRPEEGSTGAESGGPYNRYNPSGSTNAAAPAASRSGPPGLIGPIGYDVVK